MDKVYVQYIHLADDEWGYELMDRVAGEFLANVEDTRLVPRDGPVVVMAHEHGGWFMGYTRLGGKFTTVYTANDRAVYHGEKLAFRQAAYKAKWEHLGRAIRRQDDVITPADVELLRQLEAA